MNNSPQSTYKILVSGKVQGVFYRKSAADKALSLNLHGYAKNLTTGQVELMAQGNEQQILKFIEWCKQGPDIAQVTNIQTEKIESEHDFQNFAIF